MNLTPTGRVIPGQGPWGLGMGYWDADQDGNGPIEVFAGGGSNPFSSNAASSTVGETSAVAPLPEPDSPTDPITVMARVAIGSPGGVDLGIGDSTILDANSDNTMYFRLGSTNLLPRSPRTELALRDRDNGAVVQNQLFDFGVTSGKMLDMRLTYNPLDGTALAELSNLTDGGGFQTIGTLTHFRSAPTLIPPTWLSKRWLVATAPGLTRLVRLFRSRQRSLCWRLAAAL